MFFRKRVLLDTDPQELARVKNLLKRAGIKFDIKTTVSENVLSRNFNAAAAKRYNYTYSAASNQTYLYQVYVSWRDYKAAKTILSGSL